MNATLNGLDGWVPCAVRAAGPEAVVEWCYLGSAKFTDPFFEQTIQRCMFRPFNQLFARRTSIETLIELASVGPGVRPTGFIFHASRCGSTLISQMAAALPHTIAISEAPPIDQVLRADATESARKAWLRGLVSAFGQPRDGDERNLFVKFDAWHVLDLPLIQSAFPGVPCVFLYREPEEIVVSQIRMPGAHTIPGMLDPSLLGLNLEEAIRIGREEYCARLVALLFESAIEHAMAGRLALMNYVELPRAGSRRLLRWAGLPENGELRERIEAVASFDAKNPSLPYEPARPQPSAAAEKACSRFATRSYDRLESIRGHGVSLSPPC